MEKTTRFFDILKKDSAVSLKDSFLELDFGVTQKANGQNRCADGDHIRLVDSGLLSLINKFGLTGIESWRRKKKNWQCSFYWNILQYCIKYPR